MSAALAPRPRAAPPARPLTHGCPCRITVLAGDTLPIDVYCHIPIMCEDRSLPYAYVPSKTVSAGRKEPAVVTGNPVRGPGCDRRGGADPVPE